MEPQTPPPQPADPNPAKVLAYLDELESLLKVKAPDRDFQPFWSENWKPPQQQGPQPEPEPEPEPKYHGGPWGSPVDLAEAFGTSADDNWAYAGTKRANGETSVSDSSGPRERDDQSPDTTEGEGQDVPPDRR